MNRLTRQQDLAIVSAWLLGDTRDKIASDLDVSGSTVSATVGCLPPIFLELRELNKHFRKLDVSALTLSMIFKEILHQTGEGFNVDELPKLVSHALKAAKYSNHDVTHVIAADHRLSNLEEQAGKTYPEALKEYETKVAASKRINEENTKNLENNNKLKRKGLEFKKQNTEARREKKRMLKNARLTAKDLAAFNAAKRNLSEFGYSIEDALTLAQHIRFVKNSNCTPQEFGSMVKEFRSTSEATGTAKKNLEEIQLKLQASKKDEELTRLAADQEQQRLQQNKNAAEYWHNRATYSIQTAQNWERCLHKLSWAVQQQKFYHDAIIEQNIKEQELNRETADAYRSLKQMELFNRTLDEYAKAFAAIIGRQIREFSERPQAFPQSAGRYRALR